MFAKYPQSPYLGLMEEMKPNHDNYKTVYFNKKLQSFDPATTSRINNDKTNDPLFSWCKVIITVAKQQSMIDAKNQMQEIREITKELFELAIDFSVTGFAALMAPLSSHEQKVVIHLCGLWNQINVQEIIPSEADLRENEETQKALLDDLSKAADMDVYADPVDVLEKEENIPPASSPYLMELIGFEGNKDIDLAFTQAIRRVPFLADSEPLFNHEAKYESLRETKWKGGIPKEFFEDLLLIHMREVVKVKRTAISQFKFVLYEEFTQIITIFGQLCPPDFQEYDQIPMKMFFEDPIITGELITDPTHIPVVPFDTSRQTILAENVSDFSNFLSPQTPEVVNEKSFRTLLADEIHTYAKTFSLLDLQLISSLKAETLRLSMSLKKILVNNNDNPST